MGMLSLALIVATAIGPTSAVWYCNLYIHDEGFGQRYHNIFPGNSVSNLKDIKYTEQGIWGTSTKDYNDAVSAWVVPGNPNGCCRLELYEHKDFGGKMIVDFANNYDKVVKAHQVKDWGWNDKASSAKCICGSVPSSDFLLHFLAPDACKA